MGEHLDRVVALAHVRTEAGAKKYKLPIGSLIVAKGMHTIDRVPGTSGSRRGQGDGSKENPIRTADVVEAAQALQEGKYVQLHSKRVVATLLDKLAENVEEAKRSGKNAPNYDLCKVTVARTNLFCTLSKGVARINMPQLKGVPTPGSEADKMAKNDKGEVDLGPAFVEFLAGRGIQTKLSKIDAKYLKASQIELNGAKIAGMSKAMLAGKVKEEPIFVTSDDYIVDGHHRWAANVANEIRKNKAIIMPVMEIQSNIIPVLHYANYFSLQMGIPQAKV